MNAARNSRRRRLFGIGGFVTMLAGGVAAWSSFLPWASIYGGFAIQTSTGIQLGYGVPTAIAGTGLIVVGLILSVDGPVRRLDWVGLLLAVTILATFTVALIVIPQDHLPAVQPGGGGLYAFHSGFVLVGLSGVTAAICSLALAWASPFTRRKVRRFADARGLPGGQAKVPPE